MKMNVHYFQTDRVDLHLHQSNVSNSRFQINGMHSWFRSDHILPLYQSASFNLLQILNREKKNAHGCFKREYHSN